MMGFMESPYHACQEGSATREVAIGDRKMIDNLFHWTEVNFNLPGYPGYQPNCPWVYKSREEG